MLLFYWKQKCFVTSASTFPLTCRNPSWRIWSHEHPQVKHQSRTEIWDKCKYCEITGIHLLQLSIQDCLELVQNVLYSQDENLFSVRTLSRKVHHEKQMEFVDVDLFQMQNFVVYLLTMYEFLPYSNLDKLASRRSTDRS